MADTGSPTADLAAVAARFADRLHALGVQVAPDRAGRFATAVHVARPVTTDELYWFGRVTLAATPAEIAAYDRAFTDVFRGLADVADARGDQHQPKLDELSAGEQLPDSRDDSIDLPGSQPRPATRGEGRTEESERDVENPVGAPTSDEEVLRRRDFASCTPRELAELRALVARLRVATPRRPSRRRRPHRAGDAIDRRATLRRARRTGGHPAELARRTTTERRRRVILVADVSGSMESYARAYLYLLHGAVRAMQAETFVFATRLTRLTRALRLGDPERALRAAVDETHDWSGGTRIGAAIKEFNDRWGRRGLARGAVVVIVSDGWESEDPALLGEQMARLSRLAHRIVWVNPRLQSDRYQPLAGGMAAALPHVDVFTSGHSLSALDDVLAAIADD
jgi:uncharacterized protein with von Willebrand factor type A (vWA) domain